MDVSKEVSSRRAGQLPDELLPSENSDAPQKGDEATGSPAGGISSSGLAGLPDGDGSPGDVELTDVEDESEPQSGADGGAIGGTPANKRSSSR